jgi:hypothetical protein
MIDKSNEDEQRIKKKSDYLIKFPFKSAALDHLILNF